MIGVGERDEADLARAAMRGDRGAFERLVKRHQAAVRALARRLCGSMADGDDIAQSAFLQAWRRRETWQGGSFKGWVCAIAYRIFLHGKRGAAAAYAAELEDPDAWPAAEEESGERLDLMRAFAALEPKERAAVALCLGSGLSHPEAAIIMHAPVGTVKSWVNRGRAKLQARLAAYARA
jgi:RNA polymerase sigma factor (sigma-70 family)